MSLTEFSKNLAIGLVVVLLHQVLHRSLMVGKLCKEEPAEEVPMNNG